jgi:hypothetical protein
MIDGYGHFDDQMEQYGQNEAEYGQIEPDWWAEHLLWVGKEYESTR